MRSGDLRSFCRKHILQTSAVLFFSATCLAQPDTLLKHITLDEVVISAQASGFSVERFVRQVMDDTTFQHAFLNTKYHPHTLVSDLRVRNKQETATAAMFRSGRLVRDGALAELVLDSVVEKGKLRKRDGSFRYLTVEMYDDVFFPKGEYVASNTIHDRQLEIDRSSRFDKYKSELKKFMFNPGQEIASVPFIGDKLALYNDDMAVHYDNRIWADQRDGRECWVFSSDTKEGHEGKTVIQEMSTWFDQASSQVIAREYHILHRSLFLDFDIRIKVRNAVVNGDLVPVYIQYNGDWDIPFSKRELIQFALTMGDWEVK
jgi:hypothetical protein